jgi:hypothetical protein
MTPCGFEAIDGADKVAVHGRERRAVKASQNRGLSRALDQDIEASHGFKIFRVPHIPVPELHAGEP